MHPVTTMCRVLGVSPGGYWARRRRPLSARARADAELSMKIAAIHRYSRQTYGAPRIHQELTAQDVRLGCKRIARLMRAAGLRGLSRRKWIVTTVRSRGPASSQPGRTQLHRRGARLFVGGGHHLHSNLGGFRCLAVVLDGFSRRIVG